MKEQDLRPGRGFLQVRVTTAAEALPIEDAAVVVSVPMGQENGGHVLYSVLTDRSGLTPVFSLPAPPASASEQPGQPGQRAPFAEYRVQVSHPQLRAQIYEGVPVFSGVTTVQPAALDPVPAGDAMPAPQVFPPHSSWV